MARTRLSRRKGAAAPPPPVKRAHSPASARAVNTPAAAPAPQGRVEQVKAVWSMTRQANPKLPLIVFGPPIVVLAVLVVVGVLIGHIITFAILGVLAALLAGTSIFGRQATGNMYASVEGQVGAAAGLLQGMRGDWRVTPAVAFTRNQDLVHRVAGRAGVVFVSEGPSVSAQRQLVVDQKRRVNRVAPEVATHEVYVGEGEGQIPLRKLQNAVMRLPRTMKPAQVDDLEHRLKALGGTNMPLPKGPLPKGVRMPKGAGAPRPR
jgi:hypothetical protein